MKIKIYLNISIYSQTLFKYMNGQLMETIIFKYFLKILKNLNNYVFDFSKNFTWNAFVISYFHMFSICSQIFITFRCFCDFFFIIIIFYYKLITKVYCYMRIYLIVKVQWINKLDTCININSSLSIMGHLPQSHA